MAEVGDSPVINPDGNGDDDQNPNQNPNEVPNQNLPPLNPFYS